MYTSTLRAQARGLRPPSLITRVTYTQQAANRSPRPRLSPSVSKRAPPIPLSKRRSTRSPRQEDSPVPSQSKQQWSSVDAISSALHDASSETNNLLAPVHIPEDPNSVLNERHPAAKILANSGVVVTRQLELMNVMLGFEQANKYVIMDPHGNHIGFMAERDLGMGNMMKRQFFSTHRSFTTHVFDKEQREVLRFHRPFSWISSRIGVYDPLETAASHSTEQGLTTTAPGALTTEVNPETAQVSRLPLSDVRIIGEAQQQWAPLRRKYNLFLYRGSSSAADPTTPQLTSGALPLSNSKQLQPLAKSENNTDMPPGEYSQFAYIDERFLSWDFSLLSSDNRLLGSVNRNFAGFGREIFTDTGVYALRMDAANLAEEPSHLISKTGQTSEIEEGGMTLDQRAVMLATAVSVDFDYFSRKSGSGGVGGGFMPLWFPGMGGGGAAAEAEAGAGAGAIEGAEGTGGGMTRGAGGGATGEGAVVGAGGAAGYEAMQRGGYGDDAFPTNGQMDQGQFGNPPPGQQPGQVGQGEDVWGGNDDPWGGDQGDGGGGGDGGDGGGFGIGDWL